MHKRRGLGELYTEGALLETATKLRFLEKLVAAPDCPKGCKEWLETLVPILRALRDVLESPACRDIGK